MVTKKTTAKPVAKPKKLPSKAKASTANKEVAKPNKSKTASKVSEKQVKKSLLSKGVSKLISRLIPKPKSSAGSNKVIGVSSAKVKKIVEEIKEKNNKLNVDSKTDISKTMKTKVAKASAVKASKSATEKSASAKVKKAPATPKAKAEKSIVKKVVAKKATSAKAKPESEGVAKKISPAKKLAQSEAKSKKVSKAVTLEEDLEQVKLANDTEDKIEDSADIDESSTKKSSKKKDTDEDKVVDIFELASKISKAYKKEGFVTRDTIDEVMGNDASDETFSGLMSILQDLNIKISKTKRSGSSGKSEAPSDDVPSEVIKNSTKMYVSKITNIPLLTKQDEVEIAKRIEGGRNSLLAVLAKIPEVHQYVMKLYDQIVSSGILIREVVEIDSLYYSKFENNYTEEGEEPANREESEISRFNAFEVTEESTDDSFDDENYTGEGDGEGKPATTEESAMEYIKDGTISFTTMEKTLNNYVIKFFSKMCAISKQLLEMVEKDRELDIFGDAKYIELTEELFELMKGVKIHQNVTNILMKNINSLRAEMIEYEYEIIGILSDDTIHSSEVVKEFIQKCNLGDQKLLDGPLKITHTKLAANIKKKKSALAAVLKKVGILYERKILLDSNAFRKLAVMMQASNRDTINAKQEMIQSNLKLVLAIAKRYSSKSVPLLDLIQEGNIGLIKAVDKFEYRRSCKFATYATWWIKQRVSKAINDQGKGVRIPVHMIENCSKMNKIKRDLHKTLGREATPEEIAKKMGMTVDKILKIMRIVRDTMSLEIPVGDEDGASIGSFIEDSNTKSPFSTTAECNLRNITSKQLATLTSREERVLRMRFGIGLPSDHTLEEVGATFGVTRERVRQIEAKALRKLRHVTRSVYFNDYLKSEDD